MDDEIKRLLKQAEEGDESATRSLVRRMRAGDEALLEALQEARAESLPEPQPGCTWCAEDRHALAELMDLADQRPEDAWQELDAAWERRSGECYHAQVLGTRAQVERGRRRLDEAKRILDEADRLARRCWYAQVDLKRRRSYLLMDLGRFSEAEQLISEALHDYETMD